MTTDDFTFDVEIEKLDDEQQNMFGWFYKSHHPDGTLFLDRQQDFCDDVDVLEKTAYDFVLTSREGDVMHLEVPVSDMIESMVFTPEKLEKMGVPEGILPTGWWGGFHVNDQSVWEDVKKGKYSMFSIGGTGVREKVDADELAAAMAKSVRKRDVSTDERKKLASKGQAKSDGSYPIANVSDLRNAIKAWGRGGATASDKAWIIRRARALGATNLLPDKWQVSKLAPSKAVVIKSEAQRERFDGVSLRKDEKGFFAHSDTTRSLSYEHAADIPDEIIELIRETWASVGSPEHH